MPFDLPIPQRRQPWVAAPFWLVDLWDGNLLKHLSDVVLASLGLLDDCGRGLERSSYSDAIRG